MGQFFGLNESYASLLFFVFLNFLVFMETMDPFLEF